MRRKPKQPVFPTRLESTRRRFEQWRKTRSGGRPRIPESLWSLATRAARQFGVHRTCRALRLDYVVLKRHVETDATRGRPRQEAHRPGFVELVPSGSSSPTECVVEIEDPSGARMRIEIKGVAAPDLVTLTRSLRAGGA
jgi:hypothetical protein